MGSAVQCLLSSQQWNGAWIISSALTMVQYAMGMCAWQGSDFCSLFSSEASSQFFMMCKSTASNSARSPEKDFFKSFLLPFQFLKRYFQLEHVSWWKESMSICLWFHQVNDRDVIVEISSRYLENFKIFDFWTQRNPRLIFSFFYFSAFFNSEKEINRKLFLLINKYLVWNSELKFWPEECCENFFLK